MKVIRDGKGKRCTKSHVCKGCKSLILLDLSDLVISWPDDEPISKKWVCVVCKTCNSLQAPTPKSTKPVYKPTIPSSSSYVPHPPDYYIDDTTMPWLNRPSTPYISTYCSSNSLSPYNIPASESKPTLSNFCQAVDLQPISREPRSPSPSVYISIATDYTSD